ncbi:serine-rich adhesin for platelets-like [Impatiens glandulifera]|uniref:serine-rich adhesin for platelets-like n=1 Tax=Impatiens glandulifera TaxID=253017 RepID=UPI001FB08ABD|nr:serine-rich adhesin for platelets-like [Impatiens glandulifera]
MNTQKNPIDNLESPAVVAVNPEISRVKTLTVTDHPLVNTLQDDQRLGLSHKSIVDSELGHVENEKVVSEGNGWHPLSQSIQKVNDLVWAKVKNYPWWPGQIFNPSDASDKAKKYQNRYGLLIGFFSDQTFAWSEVSRVKPFHSNFSRMEKQSESESFLNAVGSALDEVSRRVQFGLSCRCYPVELSDKIRTQIVVNAGIREESSRREFAGDNHSSATSFVPIDLVCYVKQLAVENPRDRIERLDFSMAQARLLAFNRWKGYYELPEFKVSDGLFLEDVVDDDELIISSYTKVKSNLSQKKHNRKSTPLSLTKKHKINESDFSSPKQLSRVGENRKSTSLSLIKKRKIIESDLSSPKQLSRVGESMCRVASLLVRDNPNGSNGRSSSSGIKKKFSPVVAPSSPLCSLSLSIYIFLRVVSICGGLLSNLIDSSICKVAMALDSTDSELKRIFLIDDSNEDSNLNVCSPPSSTGCCEEDHQASSESILEVDDDCTSSNLLEIANHEKVLAIFDAIHKEQTAQLVESLESESTKTMDKINLCKSLAQNHAFITSAECNAEAEDDCTSSNLLEIANHEKVLEIFDAIHKEQTAQLVESLESESCKSLARDHAFTTSAECVLEAEDDCTSSNLQEIANREKVLEIFDAIHKEQTAQWVESLESESTKAIMDKINLSKSLAQNHAFITSAECITEAEDDCTDSNLLEIANHEKVLEIFDAIHKEQTTQLVEDLESENTKAMNKIKFCKSLAQDHPFTTSAECVLEAEDDCTSFNLLEIANHEKVLEIFDVIHKEQTAQWVESLESEHTTAIMDKINLSKSLAQNHTFITNAECITEAENDCTSSNLLEIANHEKVLEIFDVIHKEQTAQMIESLESESTKAMMDTINLCNSSAQNHAFIASAECITEAENDCTSSNLLEIANHEKVLEIFDVIHKEQTAQLVKSLEFESTKTMDKINLCKSLAQNHAFMTEADDDCTSSKLLEVGNIDKVLEGIDVIHNDEKPQLVVNSEPESSKEIDKIKLRKSLASDNAFITSAECITEAEDACTSSSLLEVGNSDKVLAISDVIHDEQTPQLVESSEPESTSEMDKIHLCKSLAQDAFITSAECVTQVEDDCTRSNLLEACIIEKGLEITNVSHNEQTSQLVESSELESTNEIVNVNLFKSLSPDNAVITSAECVTEAEHDCTSFNLREVANIEKVSEMADVSHNELIPQLVESPESKSTREMDNTFNKSAECIMKAKDDCKTSNLVEVAILEKVVGLTDVSHIEQAPQLVESLEPECSREISKINLCKSLSRENTSFKTAECIPEVKEDCESSNLLQIANNEMLKITDASHKKETPQLVEYSNLESSRKSRKIDMRKSLAWDSAFLTNSDCILEAKDDCSNSILLEDDDLEKVPEITDVSHREQSPQLAESSKPESRRKVSKIDMRKSLAWDSAFFTTADCMLDAEDDFSSSNLLEGSDLEKVPEITDVSHKEKTPQLVESSEPENTRKTSKINLRKSLAWNNAFFTSAGVLDAQELSIMIDGADKGKTPALPGIEEDVRGSMDTISTLDSDCLTLESLEADLFHDVRASIQKSSKASNTGSSSLKAVSEEKMAKGICASKKVYLPPKNIVMRTKPTSKKEAIPGPDRTTKQAAASRNVSLNSSNPTMSSTAVSKRVSIDASRAKSVNSVAKAVISSNYGAPTKTMPKSTALAPPPLHAKKDHGSSSGLDNPSRIVPLRKKLEPRRVTPVSSSNSTLHKTSSMAAAQTRKGPSSSKLSSSISPASSFSESTDSSSSISIISSELKENPTRANEPLPGKASGLRMPSPKMGYFDGAKTAAAQTSVQSNSSMPVGLRRFSGRTAGSAASKAVASSSEKASVVTTQTGKNMVNKNASKSTTLLKEGKLSIDSRRVSNELGPFHHLNGGEKNARRENQIEDSNRKQTNLNLKSLERRPPFSAKNT